MIWTAGKRSMIPFSRVNHVGPSMLWMVASNKQWLQPWIQAGAGCLSILRGRPGPIPWEGCKYTHFKAVSGLLPVA